MAIYHFSGQILGRAGKLNPDGTGRPGSKAVAAAAYRSGERLSDHTHKEDHDYSRRRGVAHSEILAPPGSAPWLTNRELLWNTVEAMESRRDAQLAREFNMALPHELNHEQRLELARDFVEMHFVRRGMVADLALHNPNPDEGQNAKNYHAHVMLTLRRATPDGLDAIKTREWNSRELLNVWRSEWALACNKALERAGARDRVDHRTLVAQRDEALARKDRAAALMLNRQPEIHVGPKAREQGRAGRPPRSRDQLVGPARKPAGGQEAERRKRAYSQHDQGTRLDHLKRLLVGNDYQLRQDLREIDLRFNRIARKVDYWERRVTFKAEGLLKGKEFRFNRWKAAQEEKVRKEAARRQVEHARKRLAQLQMLLKGVESLLSLGRRRREQGLLRAREVERWIESVALLRSRKRARSWSRGRGGRTR